MKPYVAYTGAKVSQTMQLDIVSKDLFTLDKMKAFKESIAASVQMAAIDASSIVITKVGLGFRV